MRPTARKENQLRDRQGASAAQGSIARSEEIVKKQDKNQEVIHLPVVTTYSIAPSLRNPP